MSKQMGMWRRVSAIVVAFSFLAMSSQMALAEESYAEEGFSSSRARSEEVTELKVQVKELLKRLEKLETEQAETKLEAAAAQAEVSKLKEAAASKPKEEAPAKDKQEAINVAMDKALSKLKIKGRWAGGFYDSGKAVSAYEKGSFELPEAKLLLTFEPDDINKLVWRMSLENATFNRLDLFFINTDLKKFFNLNWPLSSVLGRYKLNFGEEWANNNPVESSLPSNSAANVAGFDEGLQLSGKLGKAKPVGYVFSITNGSTGTGSDASRPKAFTGKLSYNITNPLYVSASYHNTGYLDTANTEIGIAGLVSRPSGATDWRRNIWEIDLRYDFQKGKVLDPPAYSDSKAILRLAYGGFNDDVTGGTKRNGHFGFVEGTYNFTKKWFAASRASFIALDDDVTATLNGVTANEYQRYSLGVGYRLTDNTHVKLGYDWNKELGAGTQEADNNQIAAVVASVF